LGLKNDELATKLERLNGAKYSLFLENGQGARRKRPEIVAIFLLFSL